MDTEKSYKHIFKFTAIVGFMLVSTVSRAIPVDILKGSDYFQTVNAFFPGLGNLKSLPVGPGNTDTIVQRQADCNLDLADNDSSCTIPIELVTLSLQGVLDPSLLIRESLLNPTASAGFMTIFINADDHEGTFGDGTFNSLFDVFFDISIDGGSTWAEAPSGAQGLTLSSSGSLWSFNPLGVIVTGLAGDQAANIHTNKTTPSQEDFFVTNGIRGSGGTPDEEPEPTKINSITATAVPSPPSVWLVGLGLVYLWSFRRKTSGIQTVMKLG